MPLDCLKFLKITLAYLIASVTELFFLINYRFNSCKDHFMKSKEFGLLLYKPDMYNVWCNTRFCNESFSNIMLTETNPFSSYSTDKLLDSYLFYKGLLGLEVELVNDQFIQLNAHGCSPVVIYHKEEHKPADFTVLNFPVRDIELIVDDFIKRGIVFEQYVTPIETDEKGISWNDSGSHIAWFKDPGGNILALIEN